MPIQRTSHMAVALGLFERMEDKMLQECFTIEDGRCAPVKEIRAHLKELRDRGYRFYPACDDVDSEGKCRGHDMIKSK